MVGEERDSEDLEKKKKKRRGKVVYELRTGDVAGEILLLAIGTALFVRLGGKMSRLAVIWSRVLLR